MGFLLSRGRTFPDLLPFFYRQPPNGRANRTTESERRSSLPPSWMAYLMAGIGGSPGDPGSPARFSDLSPVPLISTASVWAPVLDSLL